MNNETLIKFAKELKAARTKKKITLQQIKNHTRINLKFLKAIEEGNFDIMPEVYIRAFIKDYAQAIGLDGLEVLAKFDLAKQGKSEGKKPVKKEETESRSKVKAEEEPENNESKKDDKTHFLETINKNTKTFILVIISVIVLFIIIYFAFLQKSSNQLVIEKPYREILNEQKQRYEKPLKKPEKQLPAIEKNINLKIAATDTSWIKISIDNDSTNEFILYPDKYKILKAHKTFNLIIGNSGGVKMFLDGKALQLKGGKGIVKHVIIDAKGLRYIYGEKIRKK